MQQAPAPAPQEVRTPLPPQQIQSASPPQEASTPPPREIAPALSSLTSGPYIAAQLGRSRARSANFREDNPGAPDCFLFVTGTSCGGTLNNLDSSSVFGASVGYRFNPLLRVELSYQRRSGFNLRGQDPAGTDFDPPVESDAGMLTGFLDIPYKIAGVVQPIVGAGVGRSKNKMDALRWNDSSCCNGVLNDGGSNNATAWQVTLGGAIWFTRNWVLDLAYRYTDLGEFKKAAGVDQVNNFNGTGTTGSATGRLRANEVLFNLRYEFKQ